MGRLKTALLSLDVIILLVLAAGGGYYFASRQLSQKPPVCPPYPVAKTLSTTLSPSVHSNTTDWLEDVTAEMISYNSWCLGIEGEMQSLMGNTLRIENNNVSKEFTFSEDQPIQYQKIFIESGQTTPISKEEIKVGDAIKLDVCFNASIDSTGEIVYLVLNKLVSEEETLLEKAPTATPTALPSLIATPTATPSL